METIYATASLQCTQLAFSLLRKLIPLKSEGITFYKHLTINCVRCSVSVAIAAAQTDEMRDQQKKCVRQ